jgi:hypothetical protein
MYENGTIRPVETVLKKVVGEIKENDGEGESKIHCKHL